jgi:hypothetical protein
MTSRDLPEMGAGLAPADLAEVRRELFVDALSVARFDHDPVAEWEAFCERAWREAGLAFGFLDREPWPESVPRPRPHTFESSGQSESDTTL